MEVVELFYTVTAPVPVMLSQISGVAFEADCDLDLDLYVVYFLSRPQGLQS